MSTFKKNLDEHFALKVACGLVGGKLSAELEGDEIDIICQSFNNFKKLIAGQSDSGACVDWTSSGSTISSSSSSFLVGNLRNINSQNNPNSSQTIE